MYLPDDKDITHANINIQSPNGTTVLMEAAKYRRIDLLQKYLELGAKTEIKNIYGKTALYYAMGSDESVKLLLNYGADLEAPDSYGTTLLMLSMPYLIEKFLQYGASLQSVNKLMQTPLMYACVKGNIEAIKIILELKEKYDFDIEQQDLRGCTALDLAIKAKHIKAVNLLLHKTDIMKNQEIANWALLLAIRNGQYKTVRNLIAKGAEVNFHIDHRGIPWHSPLQSAIKGGHLEIIKLLLDKGALLDLHEKLNHEHLLREAVCNGRKLCLDFLLEKVAHVIQDKKELLGRLLFNAIGYYQYKLTRYLLELGANPNSSKEDNVTTLMYATQGDSTMILKTLLRSGANIEATDSNGMTALHYAAKARRYKMVKVLINHGANVHTLDHHGNNALLHVVLENATNRTPKGEEIIYGIIRLLVDKDINLSVKNKKGECFNSLVQENCNQSLIDRLKDYFL